MQGFIIWGWQTFFSSGKMFYSDLFVWPTTTILHSFFSVHSWNSHWTIIGTCKSVLHVSWFSFIYPGSLSSCTAPDFKTQIFTSAMANLLARPFMENFISIVMFFISGISNWFFYIKIILVFVLFFFKALITNWHICLFMYLLIYYLVTPIPSLESQF